ncbi:disulfide bond formation protein B [Oricola sp.]|uniref:disulfide bond formation protein B n=1 Tax=Oricola sp. TaxID=1979950 RepID=UPI003BAAC9C3
MSPETARSPHFATAMLLAFAMAVVVGTALGFEHIGGYIPCKLCLGQRLPYYIGVPVALVTGLAAMASAPRFVTRAGLAMIAGLMTWSIYLAVFHSGVEWGWWPGPADCAVVPDTGGSSNASDLLNALSETVPPSCGEAVFRFLGLSFAGWNAIASVALAALAWASVFAAGRRA